MASVSSNTSSVFSRSSERDPVKPATNIYPPECDTGDLGRFYFSAGESLKGGLSSLVTPVNRRVPIRGRNLSRGCIIHDRCNMQIATLLAVIRLNRRVKRKFLGGGTSIMSPSWIKGNGGTIQLLLPTSRSRFDNC